MYKFSILMAHSHSTRNETGEQKREDRMQQRVKNKDELKMI
jgi:hypothetical protein